MVRRSGETVNGPNTWPVCGPPRCRTDTDDARKCRLNDLARSAGARHWLRIRCGTCGPERWLDGFTISEFDPAKLLTAAIVDQARKHRKRPPEEERKIQEQRRDRTL